LGSRSASLSLQGCYIQTTCSSASDVEVQLGGREETTEGFCLPLNYRYREYELSSSRWVQHTVKQRADGSVQKVEEATDCVHASRTGTPSPAGCLLDTHATSKASPLLPGSCSKERMRRPASGLRLGSPKDLGLLFIRPHETCSCSLPEQAESLELCQLRASSLQWVRAHLPCAGARGPGGCHRPRFTSSVFGLHSSDEALRPCWPCCGRGRCWAAGPQGMAIPGIARRVEPLGPLGDGAAGGCGKTCREQVWLPSWQPPPAPCPARNPSPPPPGPVVGNARQTPHGFLDRSAIIPQPAAMLSGFATPNPNCGRHSLGGG
jgi:hypothetical protein